WVPIERCFADISSAAIRFGVDGSTMEANAALRTIVRRDTGEGYREMLARLAEESGIETPTAEDLAELIADKGCHSRDGLKALADGEWKTRIVEKKTNGLPIKKGALQ
ncbi:MAG: hypothetical protein WCJ64_12630, partial [Rhodospirillaceae bacterium]